MCLCRHEQQIHHHGDQDVACRQGSCLRAVRDLGRLTGHQIFCDMVFQPHSLRGQRISGVEECVYEQGVLMSTAWFYDSNCSGDNVSQLLKNVYMNKVC